ncbi:MAG: hypothetical protein NVSMB14_13450 [Isosphaeraceae bacterium]
MLLLAALAAIGSIGRAGDDPKAKSKDKADDPLRAARERMVRRHLIERGIKDEKVIEAFRTVPRHLYVPAGDLRRLAYEDDALQIGLKQTITPPFDVAFMIEALHLKDTDRVYEVGTGSGFNASILSRVCKEVYSVEIHKPLSERATKLIKSLGYDNVHTRAGDGYEGWPEAAPFDAVIVTCAPQFIPQPLVDQLKEGGRIVIPVSDPKNPRYDQAVYYAEKHGGKLVGMKKLRPTLFVPMTGRAEQEAKEDREKKKDDAGETDSKTKTKPKSDRSTPKKEKD